MSSLHAWFALGSIAALLACSSEPSGRRGEVGVYDGGAAGFGGVGNPDGSGGRAGDVGSADNALKVEVEDIEGMTLEVITLACAGDCADIEAVARGGHPPYAFEWEDGSSDPKRRVCLDADATLEVSATDTAIEAEELGYEAQTARAEVTADVLECADGGAPDGGPTRSCGEGAVEPALLFVAQPSLATGSWVEANGYLADYLAPSLGNAPMAIVAEAELSIELGSCTQLLLAGDAAATRALGWDDSMIVEYRSAPGAPVEKRWYYGTLGAVVHEPTNETLTSAVPPTVAGWDLDPPVLNPLPYGWESLAIDLMAQVPGDDESFVMTLYVLDAGNVGGTTDVWLIPR